ncbi:MAG: SIMPL domain-containing protein [Gammaproteobacteria bacterium]
MPTFPRTPLPLSEFVKTAALSMLAFCVAGSSPAAAALHCDSVLSLRASTTSEASPDLARITLGVRTEAKDAQSATSHNARLVQQVLDAIEALGIKPKQIQTKALSVAPRYQYQSGKAAEISHYEATNRLEVKLENLNRIGYVITAAINAGANMAHNIRFTLSDPESLKERLLIETAAKLRTKADKMARALGTKISGIASITEENIPAGIPRSAFRNTQLQTQAHKENAPVPVAAGTLKMNVNLIGKFYLADHGRIPETGCSDSRD